MTTTTDLRPATLESFKTAVECINANGGSTSLERVPATLVKKGLLVQVKPGGRGNRKSRFALTPAGITLALSLANSACTTIIVQAPDDEDGSTSVASFDSWPMPADASSTSGEPADQTTGEQVDGSTSGEIDEASSTGDTSTGEIDGTTSGSTGDGSTSTGSSGGDTASSSPQSQESCRFDR